MVCFRGVIFDLKYLCREKGEKGEKGEGILSPSIEGDNMFLLCYIIRKVFHLFKLSDIIN